MARVSDTISALTNLEKLYNVIVTISKEKVLKMYINISCKVKTVVGTTYKILKYKVFLNVIYGVNMKNKLINTQIRAH